MAAGRTARGVRGAAPGCLSATAGNSTTDDCDPAETARRGGHGEPSFPGAGTVAARDHVARSHAIGPVPRAHRRIQVALTPGCPQTLERRFIPITTVMPRHSLQS